MFDIDGISFWTQCVCVRNRSTDCKRVHGNVIQCFDYVTAEQRAQHHLTHA